MASRVAMPTGGGDGATLKELEKMITSIGGENPATTLSNAHQQQRVLATSAPRAAAMRAATTKDCLAHDSTPAPAVLRNTRRAASATPSSIKGASMAGRDRPDKRYIGKGFQPPPSESPGPIYQPPSGFAEEALVANNGFSFGRAQRNGPTGEGSSPSPSTAVSQRLPGTSTTPGPGSYRAPSAIGKQAVSTSKTAGTATFPRGPRTNHRVFLSRVHSKGNPSLESPGPGAYIHDIEHLPVANGRRAPAALMSGRDNAKVFISKAHSVDRLGVETQDIPAQYGDVRFAAFDGKHPEAPCISIGGGRRGELRPSQATVENLSNADKKMVARAHNLLSRETPGPGSYDPSAELTKQSAPAATLNGAPKTEKLFLSKQHLTNLGADSPGVKYAPSYASVDPNSPAATLGVVQAAMGVKESERFTDKVFHGKPFNTGLGKASPGPKYESTPTPAGPSYTMAHKEEIFERRAFPAPSRPRWISKDNAKDNLGTHSPGPKYDVRGDIAKEGVGFTFGTVRSTPLPPALEGELPPRAAKPLPTHPTHPSAEARPLSPSRLHGPKIAPPSTTQRRRTPLDAREEERQQAAALTKPKYDLTEPAAARVSFPIADRFGPRTAEVAQAERDKSTLWRSKKDVFSNVKYDLVEQRVKGGTFGALP